MKRIHPAVALLVAAVLAYGLALPSLGFYWDDLPMSWIRYQLGSEATTRYFSTNRPVWGLLYQIDGAILPHVPIYWQVYALLLRALTGILAWKVFKRVWPGREAFALIAAFFFLVYPGFNQQWSAFLYAHFFIVLNFFLASIYFTLRALDDPRRARLFTGLALALSALNLWMMEYFFFLELVRPFVIYFAVRSRNAPQAPRAALGRALPYLGLWFIAVLSRMFIFNNQVYSTSLLGDMKTDFFGTLARLVQLVLASFWTVGGAALGQVFQLPVPAYDGWRATLMVAAVVVSVFILAYGALRKSDAGGAAPSRLFPLSALALGLLALFFAGWPFWLIDFPPSLAHPTSRFTLPFMLGASLLWAGLLEFIPAARWKFALAGILIALCAGRQSFWMNDYRLEWNRQAALFWQMTWRAPGLTPDTTVLLNDRAFLSPAATGSLPPVDARVFNFNADNSLSAALNWTYDPDNRSDVTRYLLLYPASRIGGSLPALEKDIPIHYDYLSSKFEGNTSQIVAFYFAPPGCLRLLDPDIDALNRFIPAETLMRESAALSSSAWITPGETATPPAVYGSEPARGWCYYFERADLARQQKDWEAVVQLGETAFALDDHPNDPVERFVFIEAYAHTGDWTRAQDLSVEAFRVSKDYMAPMLCSLWARIARETPPGAEQSAAAEAMRSRFACAQ